MGLTQWLWLILLSMLWGSSYFFTSVAVQELPPFTIVLVRLLIAAFMLCVVANFLRSRIPKGKGAWKSFCVMGAIDNVIPYSLTAWGLTQIASSVVAVIGATTPFFTLLAAHFLTKDEKLSSLKLVSMFLGFIGVAIMIGPTPDQNDSTSLWGYVAILAASISYALSTIYGKRFKLMGVSPLSAATGKSACSALMLLPIALIIDQPWTLAVPSAPIITAVLASALLSTALANLLYFHLLASSGATNLSLVTFLIPASAIFLGVLILGEHLETKHLAGMTLIAAGLVMIDGRMLRKRR